MKPTDADVKKNAQNLKNNIFHVYILLFGMT